MPKRFFDDEFKAKKVWVDFQRHQNSSTGYKLKSQISKNKQKTSVKHTLNSEVVIKITGASKDFGNLKAHLRYISRNGELEVFSKENEIFQGKQSLKDLANSFNDFYEILSEKELEKLDKKPKREALHIVFSMKGVMKTPVDKIKKAAEQTIKELYPHHYFVVAISEGYYIFFTLIYRAHKNVVKARIYRYFNWVKNVFQFLRISAHFLHYNSQNSPALFIKYDYIMF